MSIKNRLRICDITRILKERADQDENLLIGQFLDDFYHEKDSEKYLLIQDEPEYLSDKQYLMCFLAAAAHKLANDYAIEVPVWTLQDKYYYPGIYYPFDTKNPEFQKVLRDSTPKEFKERGIMAGDNVLCRC